MGSSDATRPLAVLRVAISFVPEAGGPSRSIKSSVIALDAFGTSETTVLAAHRGRPRLERLGSRSTLVVEPVWRLLPGVSERWGITWSGVWWLLRNVNRFDVVHVHAAWSFIGIIAAALARMHATPVVLTPHESLTQFDRLRKRRWAKSVIAKLWNRLAREVICASTLERDATTPAVPSPRTSVVPHCVPEGSDDGRRQEGLGASRTIGFVGRFDEKKNLEQLLRNFNSLSLPRKGRELRLLIVGGGTRSSSGAKERIQRLAEANPRISIIDWLSESALNTYYSALDFLIVPSRFENFSMAAAEAMARGIPVVASRCVGASEIIARREAGIVVKSFEAPETFLHTFDKLLDMDASRYKVLVDGCRRAFERDLSMRSHANRSELIYSRLVVRSPQGHIPAL